MEQILLLCGGAFIGFLIGALFSTAKRCDNEILESHLELVMGKLREEEVNNELLKDANESLMDDYNELKKKYDNTLSELNSVKSKISMVA